LILTGQFAGRASKLERPVLILGHGRASLCADVEVLVPLHDQRDRVLHRLARHLLAVDLKHASPAATYAAYVVEGERGRSEAVIFEVELKRCLPGVSTSVPSQRTRCRSRKLYRNTGLPLST